MGVLIFPFQETLSISFLETGLHSSSTLIRAEILNHIITNLTYVNTILVNIIWKFLLFFIILYNIFCKEGQRKTYLKGTLFNVVKKVYKVVITTFYHEDVFLFKNINSHFSQQISHFYKAVCFPFVKIVCSST